MSIRPRVPTMWTRWSGSARVEQVKVACPPSGNASTAELNVSMPITGSRRTVAWVSVGSAPNSSLERWMQ
jgi:hypothetical protein